MREDCVARAFLSGALRGVGGGCEGAGYRNREVVEGCKTQATLASVRALALALSGCPMTLSTMTLSDDNIALDGIVRRGWRVDSE